MHKNFDVLFQQEASPHITEREDVPCEIRSGLGTLAGDAPVVSLEGMGDRDIRDVSAGAHHYDKCCHKYINILTLGSSGDCSPKLSHLPPPVSSHFQILSQTRQPWLLVLFSNIGSSLVDTLRIVRGSMFPSERSPLSIYEWDVKHCCAWGKQLKLIKYEKATESLLKGFRRP